MIELLRRNVSFRRLFLAHATSRAGDAFNTVALVVLVFQLTGSGVGVAGTVLFEVLPIVLLGPVAGVVVDRFSRRNVMIGADIARALLAGALAILPASVPLAYGVAFGLSVGTLLFNPSASSLLPDVVEPDEIVLANSALWTVAVTAQVILAPLAGLIISTGGPGVAFAVNAASYIGSAAWLARLAVGRRPAQLALRGWAAISEGVEAVRTRPLLARLAVVQVLASLSAGATSGLLVVLAADAYGVGPSGFGLLLACIGVGASVGPLVVRRFIRPGEKRWLFGPYALRGVVDISLAVLPHPVPAAAALTLYGAGTSTGAVAYQATLQTAVPSDVRGRVFALFDVLWSSARLVSLGLGGLLADAVGIRAVYVLGGLLLLAAFAVGVVTGPSQSERSTGDKPATT